jgi:hypothetical protein
MCSVHKSWYIHEIKCLYTNLNIQHLPFWRCFPFHIVIKLWFRSLPLYGKYDNIGLYIGLFCVELWHFVVNFFLAERTSLQMQSCSWPVLSVLSFKVSHLTLVGLDWSGLPCTCFQQILNQSQTTFFAVYLLIPSLYWTTELCARPPQHF